MRMFARLQYGRVPSIGTKSEFKINMATYVLYSQWRAQVFAV